MKLLNRYTCQFLCALLCSLPVWCAASANAPASFVGKQLKDVCTQIIKGKLDYFVINSDRVITDNIIDSGDLDGKRIKLIDDGVHVDTSHILLINRKTSSRSVRFIEPDLEFFQVKAFCDGTSEYKIIYTLSTKSIGSGKQNQDFELGVEGPGENDRTHHKINFTANILSPEIEWEESPTISSEATNFFLGKKNSLILKIKNSGNTPLVVTGLEPGSADGNWYMVDLKSCHNPSVAPQKSCDIVLTRTGTPKIKHGAVYTLNLLSNYKMGYPQFQIEWSENATKIRFYWY